MRSRIPLLILAGLVLTQVAPASSVHAAPTDIARAPNLTLRACSGGPDALPGSGGGGGGKTFTCVVRAVGDVTGDRFDDLVLEWISTQELVSGKLIEGNRRQFDLIVGPYNNSMPVAAASFYLTADQVRAPLSLIDVNGDGLKDVVFSSSELMGSYEAQRVAVTLGRRSWTAGSRAKIDLGRASQADIVIERRATLAGKVAVFGPGTAVTPAFADVDGDGKSDLVLGLDSAFMGNIDRFNAVLPDGIGSSEVAVMLGNGSWAAQTAYRDDMLWSDLGVCRQSVAGVADVTGDRVADIVARRCPGGGLPDELRVVAGGAEIARSIELAPMTARGPLAQNYDTASDGGGDNPNVPPPAPDPGRGYLPAPGKIDPTPFTPQPFFLEDVNGDGVRDIVLGFGDNTHIWLGGEAIVGRVAKMHTDRVYVKAGYGHMAATDGWHTVDLNGDGKRDLLLTGLASASPTAAGCPTNARCAPGLANGQQGLGLTSMRFYNTAWAGADVLDVDLDAPDAVWEDTRLAPWAMGDFNGDGQADLLLGQPLSNGVTTAATFSLAFGPF